MKIQKETVLAPYTTFKIGGPAAFFCSVKKEEEIIEAISFGKENNLPIFVLGGGSNVLVSDKGFAGLVIKMELQGISLEERANERIFTVMAGENWDKFVERTIKEKAWGLENLSGIPGTVGASPVQNIGAYGVEVKDFISSVKAINMENGEVKEFSKEECHFSYRSSFFKTALGRKWIIISVTLSLPLLGVPNLSYKDLKEFFVSGTFSQEEVRRAVLSIRGKKFPNLSQFGTAGSFWKNPVISQKVFADLVSKYPDMPSFPAGRENVKVSLAWILDKVCGLKGYEHQGVALFQNQPLVLVAMKGATSGQIEAFQAKIGAIVHQKTALNIEPEVVFL